MPPRQPKPRNPLDDLPTSQASLDKLLQLRELAAEREKKARPRDPVEFVLVEPRQRPQWGP